MTDINHVTFPNVNITSHQHLEPNIRQSQSRKLSDATQPPLSLTKNQYSNGDRLFSPNDGNESHDPYITLSNEYPQGLQKLRCMKIHSCNAYFHLTRDLSDPRIEPSRRGHSSQNQASVPGYLFHSDAKICFSTKSP